MFTGLVQSIGEVNNVKFSDSDARFVIDLGELPESEIDIGESISVSGVCLTVTKILDHSFQADVSEATLSRTVLSDWKVGTRVNLELALRLSSRLGGHLVSGHVDGLGVLSDRAEQGGSAAMCFRASQNLAAYIAEKGSICIDGVSLTVNGVRDLESSSGSDLNGVEFDVNIVPHTLEVTTLGNYSQGQLVNLEVDIIARYLERLSRKEGQSY